MQNNPTSLARAFVAAALRGDDALARAAADTAAPRRRLAAALRDAHAEARLRIATLRAAETGARPGAIPAALRDRLVAEAEEQLHRLETIFAQLGERPGCGRAAALHAALLPDGAWAAGRAGTLGALEAEERRGAEEARALRTLAHLSGQHLAARLLDLTAQERAAAARDVARLRMRNDPGMRRLEGMRRRA